jgi:adenylate kinase
VRGPEHSSPFSAFASAKAKFLLLGPSNPLPAELILQVRSLHLEHVSPALLHLPLLRKWFWARKPDAGFLLEGFPATLLQALVFDEWLEARGENLTACFASETTPVDLVTYYRTQGLTPVSLPAAA